MALVLGALWLCTQLTTTLGAAKGRNPVRTTLFAYAFVLLASYGSASSGYLPADERSDRRPRDGDRLRADLRGPGRRATASAAATRLYFLLRVMVVCGSAVAVVGILQYPRSAST